MKFTIILVSTILLTVGCATEFDIVSSDVPQAVIASYQQKYPNATLPKWEVEKHKQEPMVFEVAFKLNGKRIEALFKPDGTFVKEE